MRRENIAAGKYAVALQIDRDFVTVGNRVIRVRYDYGHGYDRTTLAVPSPKPPDLKLLSDRLRNGHGLSKQERQDTAEVLESFSHLLDDGISGHIANDALRRLRRAVSVCLEGESGCDMRRDIDEAEKKRKGLLV